MRMYFSSVPAGKFCSKGIPLRPGHAHRAAGG